MGLGFIWYLIWWFNYGLAFICGAFSGMLAVYVVLICCLDLILKWFWLVFWVLALFCVVFVVSAVNVVLV